MSHIRYNGAKPRVSPIPTRIVNDSNKVQTQKYKVSPKIIFVMVLTTYL